MGEVLEEGDELDNVVLLDDLEANFVGGPLFVDGNDHATARYGECGGESMEISKIVCK